MDTAISHYHHNGQNSQGIRVILLSLTIAFGVLGCRTVKSQIRTCSRDLPGWTRLPTLELWWCHSPSPPAPLAASLHRLLESPTPPRTHRLPYPPYTHTHTYTHTNKRSKSTKTLKSRTVCKEEVCDGLGKHARCCCGRKDDEWLKIGLYCNDTSRNNSKIFPTEMCLFRLIYSRVLEYCLRRLYGLRSKHDKLGGKNRQSA